MKKQSPDYYFELVDGKSIIIYGDVWRHFAISGTYVSILNSLSDVEILESTLEYVEDDCYVDGWTCIFTYDYTIDNKRKREIKSFDKSWDFIKYAKSFFKNPFQSVSDRNCLHR